MNDECDVPKCVRNSCMGYYGYAVCEYHWCWHCDEDKDFDLNKLFGIEQKKIGGV
jgi:hypothetical protein